MYSYVTLVLSTKHGLWLKVTQTKCPSVIVLNYTCVLSQLIAFIPFEKFIEKLLISKDYLLLIITRYFCHVISLDAFFLASMSSPCSIILIYSLLWKKTPTTCTFLIDKLEALIDRQLCKSGVISRNKKIWYSIKMSATAIDYEELPRVTGEIPRDPG